MKPQGGQAKDVHQQGDYPHLTPAPGEERRHGLGPKQGHSSVDFSPSPSPYGPVSPWQHLPAAPSNTHGATTRWQEGRCPGGKVLCIPRGPVLLSKRFWFLSYVVCDSSKQKVRRKRNETDCTELFKIKQKSRGSGSLSQVSHSTNSQILVISLCYGFHYRGEYIKPDDQRESTGPTAARFLPQKPPGQRGLIFPNCHPGAWVSSGTCRRGEKRHS